jgi:hypothetical protein
VNIFDNKIKIVAGSGLSPGSIPPNPARIIEKRPWENEEKRRASEVPAGWDLGIGNRSDSSRNKNESLERA